MNYRDLTNKYGFIKSKTDMLSSEGDLSQSRNNKYDYNPPENYVPLHERFYKYARIQNPTITLDPQAYRNQHEHRYLQGSSNRKYRNKLSSSSEFQQSDIENSQSSEDIDCHAHHGYTRTKLHNRERISQQQSSFELSPYEGKDSSQSNDSFSREQQYQQRINRETSGLKKTSKPMKRIEQQSRNIDYSGDSNIERLKKANQHQRKSMDKFQKARDLVRQKLRFQKEQQVKKRNQQWNDELSEQGFLQSARFNENFQKPSGDNQKYAYQVEASKLQRQKRKEYKTKKQGKQYENKKSQSSQSSEQNHYLKRKQQKKKELQQQEQLISKYEAKQFSPQRSSILKKPISHPNIPSFSKQKKSKLPKKQKSSRDEGVQVNQLKAKQNNPENPRPQKSVNKPVAFTIDSNREDMSLAQAFKVHCSGLRHKLKQQRQEFRGHHQHQKKNKKQNKKNAKKKKTFIKNKFRNSSHQHQTLSQQTHYSSPFAGRNNPLQEFKRMDAIRRRLLAKKYDKVTRCKLLD